MNLSNEHVLSAMTPEAVANVRSLESELLNMPNIRLPMWHLFHVGTYSRTAMIPAGCVATGALIKIPTLLIVSGHVSVYVDDSHVTELTGYHVLAGFAGRKQAFLAHSNTYLTMLFPTQAQTVNDAEREFTDETDLLLTNRQKSGL